MKKKHKVKKIKDETKTEFRLTCCHLASKSTTLSPSNFTVVLRAAANRVASKNWKTGRHVLLTLHNSLAELEAPLSKKTIICDTLKSQKTGFNWNKGRSEKDITIGEAWFLFLIVLIIKKASFLCDQILLPGQADNLCHCHPIHNGHALPSWKEIIGKFHRILKFLLKKSSSIRTKLMGEFWIATVLLILH